MHPRIKRIDTDQSSHSDSCKLAKLADTFLLAYFSTTTDDRQLLMLPTHRLLASVSAM